ncbi:MAG: hypothetical protein IPK72_03970 [Candidatus Eisenbacteria bacterium]|nr:hypothetical protein [Candidatus Eisenbacteria bacterium]
MDTVFAAFGRRILWLAACTLPLLAGGATPTGACESNSAALDLDSVFEDHMVRPPHTIPLGSCPRPNCTTTSCATFSTNTPFVRIASYQSLPLYNRAGCFAITKKPNGSYYHINLESNAFVYSTSPDGFAWSLGATAMSGVGSWFDGVKCPDPHFVGNGVRGYMYFRGSGPTQGGIGYAGTTDGGITWTPTAAPVLPDDEPGYYFDNPSVVEYQGQYLMAYTKVCGEAGIPPFTLATINLATSPNKITWTKTPQNPVLTTGPCGTWDEGAVCNPALVVDPNGVTLHLFYTGAGWVNQNTRGCVKIGHAVSTDGGVTWCKDPLPVLDRPAAGSLAWDNLQYYVSSYTVEDNSSVIRMYYWAAGTGGDGLGVAKARFPFLDCAPRPLAENAVDLGARRDADLTPIAAASLSSRPNPSTGRTELLYRGTALTGAVSLVVYNAQGQRVRAIWNGSGVSPERAFEWDGLDEDGGPVPTGIYLARITSGATEIATGTITLIR